MEPIKVITVWEPWAILIALLEKGNETRGWPTKHRGPLAIHAAKKIDYEACEHPLIKSVLAKHGYTAENLPTGVIVAKCNLVECWAVGEVNNSKETVLFNAARGEMKNIDSQERTFGDYSSGRFAWELGDIERLAEPIPAKGQQGLWNWTQPQ